MKFKVIYLALSLLFFIAGGTTAQEKPAENWFHLDAQENEVNGVSTDKAYEYLKGRESKTVIVAVIDSGIDVDHEDLKDNVWTNSDEIAGNGIDDDNNGFIDDVHGWNFIGGKDGKNVNHESLEVTREYKKLQPKYENKKASKKADYLYWIKVRDGYLTSSKKANTQYSYYDSVRSSMIRYNQLMTAYLEVEHLTVEELTKVSTEDKVITDATGFLGAWLPRFGGMPMEEVAKYFDRVVEHFGSQVKYYYSLELNSRTIIGDEPTNLKEVGYGNNDVIGIGTDNMHGTHVAGTIGAVRGNEIGMDGVANNVQIMAVRVVPPVGDERDKDVANAIRYAVDNGAQIINMSFGKGFSPNKSYVDDAVKYAESKGVLLIHAAGNDGNNTAEENYFPTKKIGKKVASNWIEVGASAWGEGKNLAASFSNYSKTNVDLFAPGVDIYATFPNNEYNSISGTSMASPVTAGVAAMLLSYFPELSATDLKDIMMKSVRTFDGLMVAKPGSREDKIDFAELSTSGGIVNAYEAVKLADSRELAQNK
jgi:subtilisin family serine protease